jgi:predicted nucleic acid-binding protein
VRRLGNRLRLPAVVVMELRAGVRSDEHLAAVSQLVDVYRLRNRVITPGFEGWAEAGRVLSDLARNERFTYADHEKSLVNDVLIAVCCREADAALITENAADFARIARHLRGFRFLGTDFGS